MANTTVGYQLIVHSSSEKIFSCGFCAAQFYSSQLLVEHYDEHFMPENCGNCDQQLLFINGVHFYLHLHIATKCFERKQRILHADDKGPAKILAISTEVDIKEEIYEDPLINEAHTKKEYRIRKNDLAEEAECLQTLEMDYVADLQWSEEWNGSVSNVVKLEKTSKREANIEKTISKNPQTGRSDQNNLLGTTWNPKQSHGTINAECSPITGIAKKSSQFITSNAVTQQKQRKQHQCKVCLAYLPTQHTLKAHIKGHRGNKVDCDICGKTVNEMYFRRHTKAHDLSKVPNLVSSLGQFECLICKKFYPNKHYALLHMQRHEINETRSRSYFECDICKLVVSSKPNLLLHMVSRHASKPSDMPLTHICTICGKGYATKMALAKHLPTHSDPKLMCSYCGKPFRKKVDLRDHLNGHEGIKPYKCRMCDKSFGRSTVLNSHMRTHTGLKPYICTEKGCDRAYAYSIDLKRHLWGQHKIYTKKHPCEICGKVFPENKILTKHLKTHP